MRRFRVLDFHTHTFLSDGVLSPMEMIRRALHQGYLAVGLTDHVGAATLPRVIEEMKRDCALAQGRWNITAFPGVEITHAPISAIGELALEAKARGAALVVVHGESIIEPVEPGTNRAALESPHVDILAHPGLLTEEEARLAAQKGIFLEISARSGHSLTNGHVVLMARRAGASLLLDSDAHDEGNLLTPSLAWSIAAGAGLEEKEIERVLWLNPRALLRKLQRRLTPLT
ncbi:MAG: histidinol phosphate phosphatase domain-containing protein [Chloroflexi bacterium]|nr:histidinol phosphate phosphatase domain-containing protein [Chloroflexota bacterium]